MMPRYLLVRVLVPLLCAAAGPGAQGSVYPFKVTFDILEIESISEGVVVAKQDALFGFGEPSVTTSVRAEAKGVGEVHTVGVMLSRNESSTTTLPVEVLECNGADLETADYTVRYFNTPKLMQTTFTVRWTGPHWVVIFSCPCAQPSAMSGEYASAQTCGIQSGIDFSGTVTFENAWGFLAAASVAYLPYYFALFCAYVVLFLLYGAMAVRHRRNSTWLHTSTLGVIAVGAIECLAMFALYAVMNSTGQPACCPAPLLALAAVALNTLKRTISRVLLLVICLGVGVVRPTLDKCRTGVVATVGSLFFVLVLWKDCSLLESNGAPKTSISALSLPVLFLDASFLTWIFYALAQIKEELQDASDWTSTKQSKLKMYVALNTTLVVFSCVWVVLVAVAIANARKLFELPWALQWIFHSFWHTAYFFVLVTIAWVWKPSKTSDKLGYWFGPPSAEDADEWSNLEATGRAGARGGGGGGGYGSGDTSSHKTVEENERVPLVLGGGGGGGGGGGANWSYQGRG